MSGDETLNVTGVYDEETDQVELHVEFLDPEGVTVREWRGPAPSIPVGDPHALIEPDGTVRVTWHDIAPDTTNNRVFFLELGCAVDRDG